MCAGGKGAIGGGGGVLGATIPNHTVVVGDAPPQGGGWEEGGMDDVCAEFQCLTYSHEPRFGGQVKSGGPRCNNMVLGG